jgi:hypothetical protein
MPTLHGSCMEAILCCRLAGDRCESQMSARKAPKHGRGASSTGPVHGLAAAAERAGPGAARAPALPPALQSRWQRVNAARAFSHRLGTYVQGRTVVSRSDCVPQKPCWFEHPKDPITTAARVWCVEGFAVTARSVLRRTVLRDLLRSTRRATCTQAGPARRRGGYSCTGRAGRPSASASGCYGRMATCTGPCTSSTDDRTGPGVRLLYARWRVTRSSSCTRSCCCDMST